MRKTIDSFAGRPVGARRDKDGKITHLKFSRRIRATSIKKVYSVIRQSQAEGIKIVACNDNELKLVLDERVMGFESLDDLPEI